ncbi:hypothetical protein B6S44_28990 [Bosea sp. Tri-44]|uniref:hypothetical protein n=1 Tax=Bosea sp. Tri-44 TaxID=1972137 RepID=UPI001024FC6D|nr:hypothetical protein [Bosea sp. Tri-44]RXT43100.1 hypothetical protein B6S44_28990 [Bosea sp. Tri-44]
MDPRYPLTPDGRYFLVAGRLWRATDPSIPEARRQDLVRDLMGARRAVKNRDLKTSSLKAKRRTPRWAESHGTKGVAGGCDPNAKCAEPVGEAHPNQGDRNADPITY